jgi:filamentous hemagglutinin family protein
MKAIPIVLCAAFVACTASAQSNVYTLNIVGYVNNLFAPGYTLFANPLNDEAGNTISNLFGSATPQGATVFLWNPSTLSFDTSSTYDSGSWSGELTLNPGTGALIQTPALFTNTFVGSVVNRTGDPFTEGDELVPAPPFSGPNGIYLMADRIPVGGSVSNFFYYVMGRAPNNGEQVITLSGSTTYSFGTWSTNLTIDVGDAVFINVGPSGSFDPLAVLPVPEPSALSLVLLGSALLIRSSRRLR